MNADQILDREFLGMRAKILEVAASLDRIERAEGSVASDSRSELIAKAIEILSGGGTDRAEKLQMLFSKDFDENWKSVFNLKERA